MIIQLLKSEFIQLVQVAEWQSNRTDVRGQVKTMHDILSILNDEMKELGANNPNILVS